ncbi:MAG: recombinase family protein [Bacteroidetes bacterium]|nr:recombinase family protein [Bacteroidota bacterium]
MKAVIYARVSTLEQNTERQINELKEYAKKLSFEVIEIFEEKISGTTKNLDRPAFHALLDFIQENNIKHIFSHELSRVGRNLRHTIDIIDELSKDGVCIHTEKEGIRTLNPDGSISGEATLRVGIFASIAQMEVETLKTRVKSGLKNSKLNGGANSAVQPFGFQSINKKLAIQPKEAEIIKEIYSKYLEGMSMNKIAQHLNDLGVQTRKNKRWVDKTINDILTNPLYKGERYHNKEKVPYNLEVIIPIENWEAVQSIIKAKAKHHNRDSKNINLLKGLAYCGKCGEPLYMHRRKDLSDNVYKCLSSKTGYKNKFCGSKGINIDLLNLLAFFHHSSTNVWDWNKIESKVKKRNKELYKKIEVIENNIKKLEKEFSRLTNGYVKEIIPESIFINQSKSYNEEISALESRINKYKRKLEVVPNKPKKDIFDMSGENFIGEFQKTITRIEVKDIPLKGTPFNQRKDNIVYQIKLTMWGYEELIQYVSSRDKRVFDRNWIETDLTLWKAKKIEI